MLLALALSLLSPVWGDFASIHVHNHLNSSVQPCENFYRHVCPIGMDEKDMVRKKAEKFYEDISLAQKSRTLNNPVMADIAEGRANINCTFDASVYTGLLRERCKTDFDCFFDEYRYYFTLYNRTNDYVDDSLKFYLTHGNKTVARNTTQSVIATTKMVELLYKNSNNTLHFNRTIASYTGIHDRLFVMEYLNATDGMDKVGVEMLHNQTRDLKKIILKQFQETPWMRTINDFGFTILNQYLQILDELLIFTDFDNFDKNLTTVRKINHEVTTRYFENSKRTTGCAWFDVVAALNTTGIEMEAKYAGNYQEEFDYYRATYGLVYNAFNYVDASMIDMFAAIFYPTVENSTETTKIASAGGVLGHEIYHSFVQDGIVNRSEEYKSEKACLAQHYNTSCQLFAETECNSGEKTFSEDGPDVEGMRAAFELLKQTFTGEQLKELEYADLQITREQSFFYSVAMRSCYDLSKGIYLEHSPDNIRVNALVSQFPEFTQAFNCKADDVLFAEPDQQCYLFGAKANGVWNNSTTAGEKKRTSQSGLQVVIDVVDEGAQLLEDE